MAARKDRGKKKTSKPKKAPGSGSRKPSTEKAKKKRPAARRAAPPKAKGRARTEGKGARKKPVAGKLKKGAGKVPAGSKRPDELRRASKAEAAQKPKVAKQPAPSKPAPISKPPVPEKVTAAAGESDASLKLPVPHDSITITERTLESGERKKKLEKLRESRRRKRSQSGVAPRPPSAVPALPQKFIGVPSFSGPNATKYTVPPPPPPPKPPPPPTIEERTQLLQTRLAKQNEEFRQRYFESLDMSWIYHESALEGIVYSFQELKAAIGSGPTVVQDSNLQPVCEDIRRHKAAIEFIRDYAKKRLPVTVDVIKRIYLILHPEEGDIKTVKYRKDIPQHRLYFHEYAPPDKIAYKVRQIVDWLNDPETKRGRNALRIAARAHYDFLRAYPFPTDSGKVARLLMNLLLMRAGYEPSIVHSTERQRYYEALKGSAAVIIHMVQEAQENALASAEKLLDEHETNTRSFVS